MRLLILTYAFPPSRHTNAKRPYYMARAFAEAGWEVDVYTGPLGMVPGDSELPGHPALRVFRVGDWITDMLQKPGQRGPLRSLFTKVLFGLMWPDPYAPWVLRTLRACGGGKGYDRVLVYIFPASLLLCGAPRNLVTRRWVFDFQESVTPQWQRLLRRSPWQRALMPLLRKLERRTLRKVGLAIFTANTNRRVYIQEGLVDERITTHIPYFYDTPVFAAPTPPLVPGFQVLYCGTFDSYGARSPETFLKSLAGFLEQVPAARSEARFLFHGDWLPGHSSIVRDLGLADLVSIQPIIGYRQYLEKLRESFALLLVVSSAHNLFMPSKIVDYFGARRPIVAFVPRDSEMREVLEQAGMADYTCDESDVNAGVEALKRLWQVYQSRTVACNSEKTRFWSSEVQTKRYLELVSQMAT